MKKGQGLSLNTIIIAIIVLIVLVVLVILLGKGVSDFNAGTNRGGCSKDPFDTMAECKNGIGLPVQIDDGSGGTVTKYCCDKKT